MQYGELYHTNYYKEVKEKNRVYYEDYCLDRTEEVPADYKTLEGFYFAFLLNEIL